MKLLTLIAGLMLTSQLTAGSGGVENLNKIIERPNIEQAAATGKGFVLSKHNTISIVGPIGSVTASDFIETLTHIKSNEVTVYLDSPGGSVIAGNSMITSMKSSGKVFNCVAKFAASMAFGILQACDNRYLTRDGVIMQHEMSYMVGGSAPHNQSLVNLFARIGDQMDREQAARLGLTYDEFKYKTIRDYWLYSVDAITDKAADGIAVVNCEAELVKEKVIRTIRSFFGSFQVQMSACPLLLKMEPIKRKRGGRGMINLDLESLKTPTAIKKLNTFTE